MKKIIKLTESDLHRIVKESVNIVLKEDYNGRYDELIKDEIHRLYELEKQVPECYFSEIRQCRIIMESIINDINIRNDISKI